MKRKIKLWCVALVATLVVWPAKAQTDTDTLREVVVTGTGTERLLRNAPVQTEVISRRMLEAYGGRSLEEILSGLTASFAFSEGDMGSQMQLGGLGNSYVLILIDGKRIHGDVGGENDLALIDAQEIERIEVVKGAQSALYGSDAMAGVVNIITRRAAREARGDEGLDYEASQTVWASHGETRHHQGLAWQAARLKGYTHLQLRHGDGWQNTTREAAEGRVLTDSRNKTVNEATNWQLAQRLSYQLATGLEVYAEGRYYTKEICRPTDGRHPSCDVYTYDLMYRNASASAGAKWKTKGGGVLTLDADWNKHAYYYEYTDITLSDGYDPLGRFTNYYPYFPGEKNLQSDQQRALVALKGIFSLPAGNTLSAGAEYRYDYLSAPMRTATGTADDWTGALYVQDELDPVRWLNLTAGLRLNQNGAFGFRATPKLSAMLSLGDFRLRAGWSQGFKTPTTKELHYRYLHTMGSATFFNMGNRDLRAQKSNYWSCGAEYRGRRLTASVTVYRNVLDRMIALVNVPVSEIPPSVTSAYSGDGSGAVTARKYMNMEDAHTHGADLNLTYNIAREVTLGGNYSWLDTEAHQWDSGRERLVRVTIDGMAHHRWNASATWTHRFRPAYRLVASLSTRGSSRRYYQNNGDGRQYQLWRLNTKHDFGGEGRRAQFTLEAGVDNIFGYVDRTMRPYHLGTNSPGTTFYTTLTIHLKRGKSVKQTIITNLKNNEENED